MSYKLDLRFGAPVVFNILIHLIMYSTTSAENQANQILVSKYYYINNQNAWLYIMLALVLLLCVIFVKVTISITVSAESLMLQFGFFNLSVPLLVLSMASFVLPLQLLLYAYVVCICIWISPFPSRVLEKLMNRLQQLPVFIVMPQQEANDQEAVRPYLEVDYEEDNENIEINFILGHA